MYPRLTKLILLSLAHPMKSCKSEHPCLVVLDVRSPVRFTPFLCIHTPFEKLLVDIRPTQNRREGLDYDRCCLPSPPFRIYTLFL